MKTSTKWILGIVIGLVIVCGILFVGTLAASRWVASDWVVDYRYGRLWSDETELPWRDMPMMGDWDGPFHWNLAAPLSLICGGSFCLGLFILLVLAVILVVRNQSRPQQPAAVEAPEPAPAPAPEPAQPAVQAPDTVCAHCGQPVQDGWSHCPHCGSPLSGDPEE
ncbi:MAG: zinc ribbon domain-containing protein [Chloroflexota bacterium]|nr:zinc ribbon domain-containing protein [Chloroflexota bacterium]